MNKFLQQAAFGESAASGLKQPTRRNVSAAVGTLNAAKPLGRATGKLTDPSVSLPGQSDDIFSVIAPYLEKIFCAAGDYIYQPNDPIEYIYFPETAVISEFEILKDGRAVGLTLYGNESAIGLSSIFGAEPANNWMQVLLSGTAYKIKSEIFKTKLLQHQTLQIPVFEYVNAHIKQLAQRIVCNSYHTIEERLCSLLLTLQDCRRNDTFPITQEQLAHFLGTHRPTITQVALTLRANQIISYVRKNLTILDRRQLEASACDCRR